MREYKPIYKNAWYDSRHIAIQRGTMEVSVKKPRFVGWCPQCGPREHTDEEGLCLICGATAYGDAADVALAHMGEIERLQERIVAARVENQLRLSGQEEDFRLSCFVCRENTKAMDERKILEEWGATPCPTCPGRDTQGGNGCRWDK